MRAEFQIVAQAQRSNFAKQRFVLLLSVNLAKITMKRISSLELSIHDTNPIVSP